jgi:hypothetical protein
MFRAYINGKGRITYFASLRSEVCTTFAVLSVITTHEWERKYHLLIYITVPIRCNSPLCFTILLFGVCGFSLQSITNIVYRPSLY